MSEIPATVGGNDQSTRKQRLRTHAAALVTLSRIFCSRA